MPPRTETAPAPAAGTAPLSQALVEALQALGVQEAWGVPGGAMAALWHAMSTSTLRLRHCRHETGAAFGAMEAHFASGRPVLLFTTTGPGLCNALTGLLAARADGARLVVVSACTSAATRGRGAIQESTPQTLPRGLYEAGPVFDQAVLLDDAEALPEVMADLAAGLQRPQGWIAHIAVPTAVQARRVALRSSRSQILDASSAARPVLAPSPAERERAGGEGGYSTTSAWPGSLALQHPSPPALSPQAGRGSQDHGALRSGLRFAGHLSPSLQAGQGIPRATPVPGDLAAGEAAAVSATTLLLHTLQSARCALWLGHGARHAAAEVRALVERTGIPAFCTPRAKGILPETHPRFVGVTGIGGHDSVAGWMLQCAPRRVIVLGSRLGEASSLLDPRMIPADGLVHVDIDPAVPGAAYPEATTRAVVADIGTLLQAVLAQLPSRAALPCAALPCATLPCKGPTLAPASPRTNARVRPEVLMDHLQRLAVDGGDATVIADSGNAFVWTTHRLRFDEPGRYRVSTAIGAMGHAAAGAVGVALGGGGRALAVVGDGAMLMHNEINTAVKYGARVVWVVLNDARWGMCAQGMQTLGLQADASFPAVDFAAYARAQGAQALRVDHEDEIEAALRQALAAPGPCLLDVQVDLEARAPACGRNRGLAQAQSASATATASAAATHPPAELAFPAR